MLWVKKSPIARDIFLCSNQLYIIVLHISSWMFQRQVYENSKQNFKRGPYELLALHLLTQKNKLLRKGFRSIDAWTYKKTGTFLNDSVFLRINFPPRFAFYCITDWRHALYKWIQILHHVNLYSLVIHSVEWVRSSNWVYCCQQRAQVQLR